MFDIFKSNSRPMGIPFFPKNGSRTRLGPWAYMRGITVVPRWYRKKTNLRCSRFNTHKIYITYDAPLNKQMFPLCEEIFYGQLVSLAIAIFFKHSLKLLQWNTNSISFYLTFFYLSYLRIPSF